MNRYKYLYSIVNQQIEKTSYAKYPANLYDPIRYVMKAGGKRIRPLLCLLACELFGGDYRKALYPAIGIEIFHNFTLLHDDMMDNADMRRGLPVVHKKWNSNIALLSGDAMSVIAYKYMSKASDRLNEILEIFSETALNICEGQQYDMDYEQKSNVTEQEYLNMITLKTAVLLACSLKVGAIAADADNDECDKIHEFGKNLGIAFQLQDDYLDVFGNPDVFGKNTGGDIIANKKTFLLINALSKADGENQKKLKSWIEAENFDNEEKISEVKKIFKNLNIDKYTIENMQKYYDIAFEIFEDINVSKENKKHLYEFAESLRYRAF
jgi:geranylgeranyl diphosphate synthase, type II